MPRTRQGSRRGSSSSSSRRSRTSRAELTFSVSLVEHHLRESGHGRRLSETVPILLTAILEFLTRRLLELAGNEAQRRGAQRLITPELLDMTVYNNTMLSELFQFATISQVARLVALIVGVDVNASYYPRRGRCCCWLALGC